MNGVSICVLASGCALNSAADAGHFDAPGLYAVSSMHSRDVGRACGAR